MEKTPLRFCIDFCTAALIHRLFEIPKDEGIAIYIDRDENENLAREITEWHVSYYRQNQNNPIRDINLAFGSDRQYVPIQAADILANETYRYVTSGGISPFLGATPVGEIDSHARTFVEAIKQYSYLNVTLFSKTGLELLLQAKARGEFGPDGLGSDNVFQKIILEGL